MIYKLECADCGKFYIGETARRFNVRLKEHSNTTRSTLSAAAEHLKNIGHRLEATKAVIIARQKITLGEELRGLGNSVPVPEAQL